MSWELFDGHNFDEAYMVTGEWEVLIRQRRVRIRIIVDRDGIYRYQNNILSRISTDRPPRISLRGYKTQEEALQAVIKEITRRV